MNKTIEQYVPFVDFLATVLGRNHEIVLHDFSDLNHSVIEIRNGTISGRQVSAPATDFVLRVLSDPAYAEMNHTECYNSISADGRPLRSSSYFIREEGKIIGMLCINVDTSLLDRLRLLSRSFDQLDPLPETAHVVIEEEVVPREEVEHFSPSPGELIKKTLNDLAEKMGKSITTLDANERIDIMRTLNANGAFLLKGAVSLVADGMGVSEPSVYRYLQKARREEKGELISMVKTA